MVIPSRLLPGLALLLLLLPRPGGGQERAIRLDVAPGEGTVTLRIGNLLEERSLREALDSGLPLRIRITTELWRKRFLDAQEGRAEWRATVVYDPLEQQYRVQAGGEEDEEEELLAFTTIDEARLALQRNFDLPLRPRRRGRFYYLATVEVETLSLSDLEELQRWLRGDLAPAVSGDRPVESALARGFRRMFIRFLALPVQRYQVRSRTFEHDG